MIAFQWEITQTTWTAPRNSCWFLFRKILARLAFLNCKYRVELLEKRYRPSWWGIIRRSFVCLASLLEHLFAVDELTNWPLFADTVTSWMVCFPLDVQRCRSSCWPKAKVHSLFTLKRGHRASETRFQVKQKDGCLFLVGAFSLCGGRWWEDGKNCPSFARRWWLTRLSHSTKFLMEKWKVSSRRLHTDVSSEYQVRTQLRNYKSQSRCERLSMSFIYFVFFFVSKNQKKKKSQKFNAKTNKFNPIHSHTWRAIKWQQHFLIRIDQWIFTVCLNCLMDYRDLMECDWML